MRNGSVVDLQIGGGEVKALVSGSEIYKVAVKVTPVSKARWQSICSDCAGAIDSLVELLQGRFSKGVMERICRQGTGLFPSPDEIKLSCSCPDWASMCKHVAAVLYAIGARLDQQPELLFRLHKVDEKELIAQAGQGLPAGRKDARRGEDPRQRRPLRDLWLEMAQSADAAAPLPVPAAKPKRARKPASKKAKAGSAGKGRAKRRTPTRRSHSAIPAESGNDQQPLKKVEN